MVINGRTKERVDKAIADIQNTVLNASLSSVAADLATAAGAASLVAQVKNADILVNNVGTAVIKPFAALTATALWGARERLRYRRATPPLGLAIKRRYLFYRLLFGSPSTWLSTGGRSTHVQPCRGSRRCAG